MASAVKTGSVSGFFEGPTACSTPMPGGLSPGLPVTNCGPSPVPTQTSSSFGSSWNSTSRQPQARGEANSDFAVGSAVRQPPRAFHDAPPSSVYQTPPVAAAAYARRPPIGSIETSLTRPVTRGLPDSSLVMVTAGPIGAHRSAAALGARAQLSARFRLGERPTGERPAAGVEAATGLTVVTPLGAPDTGPVVGGHVSSSVAGITRM